MCSPVVSMAPKGCSTPQRGSSVGLPSVSISQPGGIFAPLLCATRSLPCATALVAMSSTNGFSPGIGMPMHTGLVPKRRSAPANGATRANDCTFTKCMETRPCATAISAQWPMRPRWCELPSAVIDTPCCFARSIAIPVACRPIDWP